MDPDSGGTGVSSTGGTKDGEVRSSLTNEGSNSTEMGATDLKALGYDVGVDETGAGAAGIGFRIGKYVLYLLVVLALLSILLNIL